MPILYLARDSCDLFTFTLSIFIFKSTKLLRVYSKILDLFFIFRKSDGLLN